MTNPRCTLSVMFCKVSVNTKNVHFPQEQLSKGAPKDINFIQIQSRFTINSFFQLLLRKPRAELFLNTHTNLKTLILLKYSFVMNSQLVTSNSTCQ